MVTPTPPPRATPSSRYCAKTRDLICDLNHKTNRLILPARRFPPPWSVEKQQTCGPVCSRCYQVNVPTHLRNDDAGYETSVRGRGIRQQSPAQIRPELLDNA